MLVISRRFETPTQLNPCSPQQKKSPSEHKCSRSHENYLNPLENEGSRESHSSYKIDIGVSPPPPFYSSLSSDDGVVHCYEPNQGYNASNLIPLSRTIRRKAQHRRSSRSIRTRCNPLCLLPSPQNTVTLCQTQCTKYLNSIKGFGLGDFGKGTSSCSPSSSSTRSAGTGSTAVATSSNANSSAGHIGLGIGALGGGVIDVARFRLNITLLRDQSIVLGYHV